MFCFKLVNEKLELFRHFGSDSCDVLFLGYSLFEFYSFFCFFKKGK